MQEYVLVGIVLVWVLAAVWVIQDAYASFPRPMLAWWSGLAVLLGPLAVPLYLSERLTRRAELNKVGHGKAAFSVPDGRRPFRETGLRRFGALQRGGSGFFVVVEDGMDAPQSVEIPEVGALIIRRGMPGEHSRPGVLVLHDEAVSRDEHCRLWLRGEHIVLADRSRWGTLVEGVRIEQKTVQVHPDSTIRVGRTELRMRQEGN